MGVGGAASLLKRPVRFKSAVLGLLRHDPAQRSTMRTFMQEYVSITSSSTTQPAASEGASAPPADVSGNPWSVLFKQGSTGGVQNRWQAAEGRAEVIGTDAT